MTRPFSKTEQASVFMSAMLVMTKHNIPIAPADEFAEGVEALCRAMCDMLSVMLSKANALKAGVGVVPKSGDEPPIRYGQTKAQERDLMIREMDARRDMKIALLKMGDEEPWVDVLNGRLFCGYRTYHPTDRYYYAVRKIATAQVNGEIKGVV